MQEPEDFKPGFNFKAFSNSLNGLKFTGSQSVVLRPNPNNKGGMTTTIQNGLNPEWERDIIRRLRSIIISSGKSIQQVFDDFDEDGSGTLTTKEFRNALRKLGLGLTSKEIDKIM